MAALTAASTERPRVLGDISLRIFKFANVANGDTFTVPGAPRILGAVSISIAGAGTVIWEAPAGSATLSAGVSVGNPAVTLAVLCA